MAVYSDHNGLEVLETSEVFFPFVEYLIAGPVSSKFEQRICFQKGSVQDNGVNGVTTEALLAMLIHRAKFLDSYFPCDENKRAIQHMEEALVNFEVRTARRMVRGVEGKQVL